MTLAKTIYQHSCRLPQPAAQEALDFIEFLELRYGVKTQDTMQHDTETFIAKHVGALSQDFPADIDDFDLGVDASKDTIK
jgi:hypothetical protein